MLKHTNDYHLAAYECDHENTLATATIFNWLQDSMDRFSRACGAGYDYCYPYGLTYMLRAYDVKINSLPRWADTLEMQNVLSDIKASSMFLRHRLYHKATKQLLLSAVSHVVLIDFLKGRPAHIKDYPILQQIETLQRPVSIPRLEPLTSVDTTREQDILLDHIDFNQHVNNTNYVVFAKRALDPLFLKRNRLKRIQVAYKQAALLGDKLKIETKIEPTYTDHQISSVSQPNRQFARIRFSWQKKDFVNG